MPRRQAAPLFALLEPPLSQGGAADDGPIVIGQGIWKPYEVAKISDEPPPQSIPTAIIIQVNEEQP